MHNTMITPPSPLPPQNQLEPCDDVVHRQESTHKVPKSARHKQRLVGCSSPDHATRRTPRGASRLVQAWLAWSVKTRRTPSRHGRDAGVCGPTDYGQTHDTTITHGLPPEIGDCETYKEERDVLEEEMRKLDDCDMGEFGRLESSEKNDRHPMRWMVATDGETARG